MMKNGIDVSEWQGNIDFNKVKNSGIDFVIIRAGFGQSPSNKDKFFEINYENAKKAGLNVGAYWYSYAKSPDVSKQEAEACLKVIKGKKFEYPIYIDVEEPYQFNGRLDFCDNIISSFCDTLESHHYFTGFYISYYNLKNYISLNTSKRYALWIASWGSKPEYQVPYGMWQYSSKGKVDGVNSNCDLDYAYIDYPSIIISKKFNGYGDTSQGPTKDINQIVDEVIAGVFGNGEERKKKLTEAGYNYDEIQKLVNEKLGF